MHTSAAENAAFFAETPRSAAAAALWLPPPSRRNGGDRRPPSGQHSSLPVWAHSTGTLPSMTAGSTQLTTTMGKDVSVVGCNTIFGASCGDSAQTQPLARFSVPTVFGAGSGSGTLFRGSGAFDGAAGSSAQPGGAAPPRGRPGSASSTRLVSDGTAATQHAGRKPWNPDATSRKGGPGCTSAAASYYGSRPCAGSLQRPVLLMPGPRDAPIEPSQHGQQQQQQQQQHRTHQQQSQQAAATQQRRPDTPGGPAQAAKEHLRLHGPPAPPAAAASAMQEKSQPQSLQQTMQQPQRHEGHHDRHDQQDHQHSQLWEPAELFSDASRRGTPCQDSPLPFHSTASGQAAGNHSASTATPGDDSNRIATLQIDADTPHNDTQSCPEDQALRQLPQEWGPAGRSVRSVAGYPGTEQQSQRRNQERPPPATSECSTLSMRLLHSSPHPHPHHHASRHADGPAQAPAESPAGNPASQQQHAFYSPVPGESGHRPRAGHPVVDRQDPVQLGHRHHRHHHRQPLPPQQAHWEQIGQQRWQRSSASAPQPPSSASPLLSPLPVSAVEGSAAEVALPLQASPAGSTFSDATAALQQQHFPDLRASRRPAAQSAAGTAHEMERSKVIVMFVLSCMQHCGSCAMQRSPALCIILYASMNIP